MDPGGGNGKVEQRSVLVLATLEPEQQTVQVVASFGVVQYERWQRQSGLHDDGVERAQTTPEN